MKSMLDDIDGKFLVLVNAEGQHSLWPEPIKVPAGWHVVHSADTRENCLSYIAAHWTDLRPVSIR